MKGLWQNTTPLDRLVVLGLLLLALFGTLAVVMAPVGARVLISDGAELLFTTTLPASRQVEIDGPLGRSRLLIDAQGVRVIEAPCPLKICMSMGPAQRVGDLIACLPNRVLVEIQGAPQEGSYDLLSR